MLFRISREQSNLVVGIIIAIGILLFIVLSVLVITMSRNAGELGLLMVIVPISLFFLAQSTWRIRLFLLLIFSVNMPLLRIPVAGFNVYGIEILILVFYGLALLEVFATRRFNWHFKWTEGVLLGGWFLGIMVGFLRGYPVRHILEDARYILFVPVIVIARFVVQRYSLKALVQILILAAFTSVVFVVIEALGLREIPFINYRLVSNTYIGLFVVLWLIWRSKVTSKRQNTYVVIASMVVALLALSPTTNLSTWVVLFFAIAILPWFRGKKFGKLVFFSFSTTVLVLVSFVIFYGWMDTIIDWSYGNGFLWRFLFETQPFYKMLTGAISINSLEITPSTFTIFQHWELLTKSLQQASHEFLFGNGMGYSLTWKYYTYRETFSDIWMQSRRVDREILWILLKMGFVVGFAWIWVYLYPLMLYIKHKKRFQLLIKSKSSRKQQEWFSNISFLSWGYLVFMFLGIFTQTSGSFSLVVFQWTLFGGLTAFSDKIKYKKQ